jgi:hypothetical protein
VTDLPSAELLAVQLSSANECLDVKYLATVTIRCPFCDNTHKHRVFDNDSLAFRRTAPCSTDTSIRQYSVDLNLTVPKRDVSQPHPVHGEDRDDNAFDVPEPNWLE